MVHGVLSRAAAEPVAELPSDVLKRAAAADWSVRYPPEPRPAFVHLGRLYGFYGPPS